jgi:hypothetical protein
VRERPPRAPVNRLSAAHPPARRRTRRLASSARQGAPPARAPTPTAPPLRTRRRSCGCAPRPPPRCAPGRRPRRAARPASTAAAAQAVCCRSNGGCPAPPVAAATNAACSYRRDGDSNAASAPEPYSCLGCGWSQADCGARVVQYRLGLDSPRAAPRRWPAAKRGRGRRRRAPRTTRRGPAASKRTKIHAARLWGAASWESERLEPRAARERRPRPQVDRRRRKGPRLAEQIRDCIFCCEDSHANASLLLRVAAQV